MRFSYKQNMRCMLRHGSLFTPWALKLSAKPTAWAMNQEIFPKGSQISRVNHLKWYLVYRAKGDALSKNQKP